MFYIIKSFIAIFIFMKMNTAVTSDN